MSINLKFQDVWICYEVLLDTGEHIQDVIPSCPCCIPTTVQNIAENYRPTGFAYLKWFLHIPYSMEVTGTEDYASLFFFVGSRMDEFDKFKEELRRNT